MKADNIRNKKQLEYYNKILLLLLLLLSSILVGAYATKISKTTRRFCMCACKNTSTAARFLFKFGIGGALPNMIEMFHCGVKNLPEFLYSFS